ncbi:MAG TPA: hypothetical protein EYN82_01505 [Candidatus Marinimicrobia bacterium]|nr:hypothetical protein [Candidatus Neomarinimicrobiota bacterium]
MKLLNVKATLITTLSAIIMVSSVYADIGLENKDKPLIDIKSVQDSKKEATYNAQGEKPTSIVSEVHSDYDPGLRSTDVTIVCDGGSWQSEVSWEILTAAGDTVAAELRSAETLHWTTVYTLPMGMMPMVTVGTEIIYLLQELMVRLI